MFFGVNHKLLVWLWSDSEGGVWIHGNNLCEKWGQYSRLKLF